MKSRATQSAEGIYQHPGLAVCLFIEGVQAPSFGAYSHGKMDNQTNDPIRSRYGIAELLYTHI